MTHTAIVKVKSASGKCYTAVITIRKARFVRVARFYNILAGGIK